MAYQKVQDLSTDTVIRLGGVDTKTGSKNPGSIEGYYLGARVVETKGGSAVIHTFQTPAGNVGVWGTKYLNDTLPQVRGAMTLVNYLGKKSIPNSGGKTKHMYDIQRDLENTIEVSVLTESASQDEAEFSEETQQDEMPSEVLAKSRERADRVSALLSRKSK